MDNHIQPLPREVAAKIKSSTSITHLNGAIVQLVKNALDANARSTFVTVDYRRGGCVVEDDGDGIPQAEFQPTGGLGKAHHTSKFHPESPVQGRKGCFLASLSSLALLTITSHHVYHASTSTVIFHHSDPVARLIPAPSHHGLRFSDHGTRVTVNDLFGNMPVRVKNRALTLQKPEELDRQLEDLKYLMLALMLANDSLLKLVILDADKERKLTVRPRQGSRIDGGLDLTRLDSILSQAGLIESGNLRKWHTVSATVPQLTIHAALSLVPSPSKKVQFISLGVDPVFSQNQANILYNEVNRLFSLSDFGAADHVLSGSYTTGLEADGGRLGPAAVSKWPMFYIRIVSNAMFSEGDEELPGSDRALQRILDILTLMVNEFLKEHKMRPRGGKRQRVAPAQETESPMRSGARILCKPRAAPNAELLGPQVKLPSFSRPGMSDHFGNWSRIKSANSHSTGQIAQDKFTTQTEKSFVGSNTERLHAPTPLEEESILDVMAGYTFPEFPGHVTPAETHAQEKGDAVIPWIDSHTGIRHWINSRTGQSVNVRPSAASVLADRPRTTGSMLTRVLDSRRWPVSAVPDAQNSWLENLLDNWKSPVFGRSERPINALDTDIEHDTNTDISAHNFHKQCGLDSFGVSKYRGKLRKSDLATAKVIGQVDRKFILVGLGSRQNTSALVLIDQHAADERCRVESLSEEFFDSSSEIVQTVEVDPVHIDILGSEASMFTRQVGFFKSWGVEYAVGQSSRSDKATITVSTLPTLIAERCRTEPDQLISILRAEIWKRAEDGDGRTRTPLSKTSKQGKNWVGRLAGCPQGILDMLNSRACRTAIMFNDVLSVAECRNLVQRLANCVFPFQCAHGRPSMVPLVDFRGGLDHHPDGYGGSGSENMEFTEAFKRWQLTSQPSADL
ncbi:putative DNA mismatch repair protein (Mlh3) [Aspergillus undulatus]|uniref:putative DNA mismatch repair protein (Mlh3) n=1 Tax=Aspergillus undulatus TaxID=1810928 RepID=UPI003CCD124B